MRGILTASLALSSAILIGFVSIASVAHAASSSAYPLSTCIISGEPLGAMGDPVIKQYEGREVRFCCESCVPKFEKDVAGNLAELDAAIIQDQKAAYPVLTCVVSGESLAGGEMGDPVDLVVDNRLVRLCCNTCVKDVKADPAKYLAKLDGAVAAQQLADYPATVCPISGEELGGMGDPFDYVYAGRLVRFCCGGCIDKFNADPITAMRKVYGNAYPTSASSATSEPKAPKATPGATPSAAPAGSGENASGHSDHDHSGHDH